MFSMLVHAQGPYALTFVDIIMHHIRFQDDVGM